MDRTQHRALHENWGYLRWQLGGELGWLGDSGFYARILAPLRDTLPASGAIQPPNKRLLARVLQMGEHVLLLQFESAPATTHTGETFRPLSQYYLVERAHAEEPRIVGVGFRVVEFVENGGRVRIIVLEQPGGRLLVLDGKQSYFEEAPPKDASLQAHGVVAQ